MIALIFVAEHYESVLHVAVLHLRFGSGLKKFRFIVTNKIMASDGRRGDPTATPSTRRCMMSCGVKELIMFIARANAAITQTMYQMIYPSESYSEHFNLFLCHVSAMYQRCSISASFD